MPRYSRPRQTYLEAGSNSHEAVGKEKHRMHCIYRIRQNSIHISVYLRCAAANISIVGYEQKQICFETYRNRSQLFMVSGYSLKWSKPRRQLEAIRGHTTLFRRWLSRKSLENEKKSSCTRALHFMHSSREKKKDVNICRGENSRAAARD